MDKLGYLGWSICYSTLILTVVVPAEATLTSSSIFSTPLQKLVYTDGQLYAAGTDSIYRLDRSSLQVSFTKPLNGSVSGSLPRPVVTCLGAFGDNKLFICSSKYGQCEFINTNDLLTTSVISSRGIVTNNTAGSVVFVRANFRTGGGAQADAILLMSSYSKNAYALSIRDPTTFMTTYNEPTTVSTIGYKSRWEYYGINDGDSDPAISSLQYIYAFQADGYRLYVKNNVGRSFVGGMCDNDGRFNTLTELPLVCTSAAGGRRDYIQSAYVAVAGRDLLDSPELNSDNPSESDLFLFAVFGENASSTSTSVCVYSVASLIAKMKEVFILCHIDGNSDDVTVGSTDLIPKSSFECTVVAGLINNITLTPCQIVKTSAWSRTDDYSPIVYNLDVVRSSQIDLSFVTNSLLIDTVGRTTVAFMTSPAGQIHKAVVLKEHGVYKSHDLSEEITGSSILPSIAVGYNRIYTLTSNKVLSVPVEQCQLATDCQACTDLGDPYCGWCTLSNRCTMETNCSPLAGHWLQASSSIPGADGCIVSHIEESKIAIESKTGAEEIQLKVIINQVPVKLNEENYYCSFFDGIRTRATKMLEVLEAGQTPSLYLDCATPAVSVIQDKMVAGNDHITSNLTLELEDREFSRLALTFYDCSRHTSCTTCATAQSQFSCKWCLSSHSCSQHHGTLANTCEGRMVTHVMNIIGSQRTLAGQDYCPRILPIDGSTTEILVADGTRPQLSFRLENQQSDVDGYTCELSWDDRSASYDAEVTSSHNTHSLRCLITSPASLSYSGAESTKSVNVAIKIAGTDNTLDNPDSIKIEMYKCEQMKTTCGECLSAVADKYACGWCQATISVCQVREKCQDAVFLESQGICPNLDIVKIEPNDGPVQGQTLITIDGVNLGQSYEDIRDGVHILLRNLPRAQCHPIEPHSSHRLVCRTDESVEGAGPIRVDIPSEEMLHTNSRDDFHFYSPMVQQLSASRGPISGGSRIAIIGRYINIGSNHSVRITNHTSTVTCELLKSDLNKHELVFVTPAVDAPQQFNVSLVVDGFSVDKISGGITADFVFMADSTVSRIEPNKGILSGGTVVHVYGTSLDIIQKPMMYLKPSSALPSPRSRRHSRAIAAAGQSSATAAPNNRTFPCSNVTNTTMSCLLPPIPESWLTDNLTINYGFILDNIQNTTDLVDGPLQFPAFEVLNDPTFENFGERTVGQDSPLRIKGNNLLAIGPDDIVLPLVKVDFSLTDDKQDGSGRLACIVTTIQDVMLYCDMPELETSKKYTVTVRYGSELKRVVGSVALPHSNTLSTPVIIAIGVSCGVVLIFVIVVIVVLKCRLSKTDQGMKKLQDKMDNLEMTVAKECKEAFTELQTDMTEMTADIAALHGLPFYEYSQYCMKVLFPQNPDEHPVLRKLEITYNRDVVERGLRRFSGLIYNKTFLLTFIRTLEQQRKFVVRDRVEVASLVSVALQPRMEYHTDILKTLLAELIERTMDSKKDPKILLRRNESVAEKMLSNWFAFLLQKFLKECAGEPMYLLYRAIKQQVDKGPVDAVTSDAKYSLSEDKLLRQSVESHPITLRFCSPDPQAAHDPQTVKVLNCDTISQAIEKIVDTLHRNVPNSSKPSKDTLTLEWLKPNGERIAMYDDDPAFTKIESDSCKRIVTLQCYKITDNAMVALTFKTHSLDGKSSLPKQDTSSSNGVYHGSMGDSLSRANSSNNILDSSPGAKDRQKVLKYHLVKPSEADVHQEGDRNKMVSEIYLTRLLATKGTLQQFVDDLFETIFSTSHRGSALPLAIKYMFDFLDDQALLHSIGNPEVIHHWKSNSLPLRFWVNVIKNPDFVFDIHKSHIVDACLSVVAQIFMDSCSLSEHRLGKESPSSKLLYAKDIPKYRKWVERYYSDIKSMPAISDHDMNAALAEESRQHRNEFNNSAALFELYKYVLDYENEVLNALREDEFARKDRLAEELSMVTQMLNTSRISV